MKRKQNEKIRLGLALILLLSLVAISSGRSQSGSPPALQQIRVFQADELGPPGVTGVPLAPGFPSHLQVDEPAPGAATLVAYGAGAEDGSRDLAMALADPINLTFARRSDGGYTVLLLDDARDELVQIDFGEDLAAASPTVRRFAAASCGIKQAQGLAIDAVSGRIFILDGVRNQILRLDGAGTPTADPATANPCDSVAAIDVPQGLRKLEGIAFDPATGNLYLLSPVAQELYEIDGAGQLLAPHDLSLFGPLDLATVGFAPSSDRTDDPARMHLFVIAADGSTGKFALREWSLPQVSRVSAFFTGAAFSVAALADGPPALVQSIDAFDFDPPSPDSAGLAYQQRTDSLLMSDSEVNEMSIYEDVNVFEITRNGQLFGRFDTTHFSDEPTGVAINPVDHHCFFSDDTSPSTIYEVDPGPDDICLTDDDTTTSFETGDFDSGDPEGLAFGQGTLFIADGVNNEIYALTPGPNGVFDGVPSSGDDEVTQCDTSDVGISDPEGLAFDPGTGTLFVVGSNTSELAQITTDCQLVRMIDISAANLERPAGLALAPSSVEPGVMSLWLADRGVDNDGDPDENDGRIHEFTLPFLSPSNLPPVVSAGPDQSITFPGSAVLQGGVSDDGLPAPPSLTVLWSQVSGPGLAEFDDASSAFTAVRFSGPGTYVLRLTAGDGELQSSDDVRIAVELPGSGSVFETRIAAGDDDAEAAARR
ncbi:MAG: hypothetical protein JSU66_01225, partial [Deltaproteobacteria bacterium]